jgi:hypothetical protein
MEKNLRFPLNGWRTAVAERLEAFAAANVLFPFIIVALSVTGFALGHRLSSWVLPLAALALVFSLRVFCLSWRSVGLIVITFVAVHVGAYLVAGFFFDRSWDGLAYHQEGVLHLAAGWNPLFEQLASSGKGAHEDFAGAIPTNYVYMLVWNDHFPKASWITGATVLLTTGRIEPGKLFNFTLMAAAASQVAAVLLRLTALRVFAVAIIALLAAFNPVAIDQCTTFYVDGRMSSLLTVSVAALILYVFTLGWSALFLALLATCLMINLKFTGLAYAVVFLVAAVLGTWYRQGLKPAYKLALVAVIAGLVATCLLGYTPYIRNLREKGNLFYPMRGENLPDFTAPNRPANLVHKDRFMRFLIANFSRSERVQPPRATHLKFPLSIYPEEGPAVSSADPEAGGFGPLYGALLVMAGVGLLLLLRSASSSQSANVAVLISGILLVSIFVHSEGWWARYAPQAWLLPLVIAVACLRASERSLQWWWGRAILAIAFANVLFVGYYLTRSQLGYTRATSRCLREMSSARQPVTVYVGRFPALRERLREHGIDFKLAEAPPPADAMTAWHDIPSLLRETAWSE